IDLVFTLCRNLTCIILIVIIFIFFFQAEDGIRDSSVTGVQTCALPISFHLSFRSFSVTRAKETPERKMKSGAGSVPPSCDQTIRSEERRVGKECRSRWRADDLENIKTLSQELVESSISSSCEAERDTIA